KYSGDPAIYFDKELTAWTQYNQCKASKLDVACNITLRHGLVVLDPSSCTDEKSCNFYMAGRLGDHLSDLMTAKASLQNDDSKNGVSLDEIIRELHPTWTGSGSGSTDGIAANGSAENT